MFLARKPQCIRLYTGQIGKWFGQTLEIRHIFASIPIHPRPDSARAGAKWWPLSTEKYCHPHCHSFTEKHDHSDTLHRKFAFFLRGTATAPPNRCALDVQATLRLVRARSATGPECHAGTVFLTFFSIKLGTEEISQRTVFGAQKPTDGCASRRDDDVCKQKRKHLMQPKDKSKYQTGSCTYKHRV